MQRLLFYMALIAGTLMMPTAYPEAPVGALPQFAPGQSLGLALGMPTVPNLRDVGGYRTSDGRTVARGIAYRSDTFHPMSAEEIKKIELLALKNDYDLRTKAEVKAMPDELPPGVFHCTTGKDRTGWAAGALLTLLGVPKETVMVDYLRTNEYTLPQFQHAIDAFVAGGGERSIALAVLGVRREYLEASLDEMHMQYGSIEKYFSEDLGIDAAGQQALRTRFLGK